MAVLGQNGQVDYQTYSCSFFVRFQQFGVFVHKAKLPKNDREVIVEILFFVLLILVYVGLSL